ncbi:MAG: acyl-CoA thioesterase [Candidatus Kapaibacteriota bacterium]
MIMHLTQIEVEKNFEVQTYDIDIAGHVNNIVFIRWLEELRNKLFSAIISLEKLLANDLYLVVISSEVKYKKQIKLSDNPIGTMILENISHGVLTFNAQIQVNNKIVFYAKQKCVLMNLKTEKMFSGKLTDFISQND